MLKPFDYQVNAIEQCRDSARAGKRRILLAMLMGAGKTLISLELMRLCSELGKRSLFLCDRRMLSQQALARAQDQELHAGIILAGRGIDLSAPCQFAGRQTIDSWLKRGKIELPNFDLIIQDECHRAISPKYLELYARWPRATLIGLTATPCLGNGDGMGAYYDTIIQPIMPSGLRAMGRIVPVRAFAPHTPDLKGVKKDKDGDYSSKSLSERMNRKNLIGDVAGWWKKLAQNRPSIYFACDVAHAMSIRDEFRANGVAAELICDETPDEERDDIRDRLERGDIKVVVNCDVLAEGIDWPFVSCIGLVRPTKRLRRYLQNTGRGMRSYPSKEDCILIDHAGCVLYHGFPDVDRLWPLDPCDNIDKISKQLQLSKPASMQCSQCTAVFSGSRTCPECGHVHVITKAPKDYAKKNGTLIEVNSGDIPAEISGILQQRFWSTCIGAAIKRGKKAGMAAAMFSSKFGVPPWQAGVSPLPNNKGDWQRYATEVFPGFARGKFMRGDSYEG